MRARFSRSSSFVRSRAATALRHASNRAATPPTRVLESRVRVDEIDVLGRIEERLVFVLSVQIEQARAEIAQRRRGRERVVDEGAAAALIRHFAAHDRLAAVRTLEDGLHRRERLTRAHEVGARAAAEQQVDRPDDDGFSGASFAGEDVQARLELDFEMLDDRQMSNAQEPEHVEAGTRMISDL